MFAIKLTLILLGALQCLVGSGCWFFWIGPRLLEYGKTADIFCAFASTCGCLLITFGFVAHIIKTARPKAPHRR